jgi:hypothetical protein
LSGIKPLDAIAADKLQAACVREIQSERPQDIAATAFLAATFAQHALQALIRLLEQKNLISPQELAKALASAYNEGTDFKQAAGRLIVPMAPQTRPN